MEVYCDWVILAVFAIVCWRTVPRTREMKLLGVCLGLVSLEVESTGQGRLIAKALCAFQAAGAVFIVLLVRAMLGVARGRLGFTREPLIALGLIVFCGAGFLVAVGTLFEEGSTVPLWNIFWWTRVCVLGSLAFMIATVWFREVREFDRVLRLVCLSALVTSACLYIGLPKEGVFIRGGEDNLWLEQGRLGGMALLGFWPSTPLGPLRLGIAMNAPQMGEFAMIGLVGSVAYFLGHPRRKARNMAGGCALLLAAVIALAQARGAFTGALAGFVVSAVLMFSHAGPGRRTGVMRRVLIIFGVLSVLAVGISLWQFGRTDTGDSITSRVRALRTPGKDETLQGRVILWRTAFDLAVSKPLGSGFFTSFEQTNIRNPHNLYLWLLLGVGWIGVAGFFIVGGRVCFILRAGLNEAPPELIVVNIAVLSIMGAVAVAGLTGVFFALPAHIICLWVLVGAAVAINRAARRATPAW